MSVIKAKKYERKWSMVNMSSSFTQKSYEWRIAMGFTNKASDDDEDDA